MQKLLVISLATFLGILIIVFVGTGGFEAQLDTSPAINLHGTRTDIRSEEFAKSSAGTKSSTSSTSPATGCCFHANGKKHPPVCAVGDALTCGVVEGYPVDSCPNDCAKPPSETVRCCRYFPDWIHTPDWGMPTPRYLCGPREYEAGPEVVFCPKFDCPDENVEQGCRNYCTKNGETSSVCMHECVGICSGDGCGLGSREIYWVCVDGCYSNFNQPGLEREQCLSGCYNAVCSQV